MEFGRIEFANGLRGVAALLVVFSHFCGVYWGMREVVSAATGIPSLPDQFAVPWLLHAIDKGLWPLSAGPLGVSIFFIVSGFVIPFSFQNSSRVQFLIGRLCRIWPTYFVGFLAGMAGVYLIASWSGGIFPHFLPNIIMHSIVRARELSGTPYIDAVLWTLEVEVRFYLIAFLIGAPAWRAGSAIVFIAGSLLATVSVLVFYVPAAADLRDACRYNGYVVYLFVGVALNFHFRGLISVRTAALWIATMLISAFFLIALYIPTLFWPIVPSYLAALAIFVLAYRVPLRVWQIAPIRFFFSN